MRITYFGVRGSCPCSSNEQHRYGGNTSCVLVEVDGEPPLILDMGTGLRALGHHLATSEGQGGKPLQATALLTHLHYDHVMGTPFFPLLRVPGARLDVFGPSQPASTLHETMAGMVQPPFFPVHLADLQGDLCYRDLPDEGQISVGRISVHHRLVSHVGRTAGFRIEADGAVLAYLPDHQAPLDGVSIEAAVLELCHDADLLIHDAQYTDPEFAELADWGHSTPAYAVHLATMANVAHLDLFHHDPGHSDLHLDEMLAEARRAAPDTLIVGSAQEGTVVEIGVR